jgi:hypothetical protein
MIARGWEVHTLRAYLEGRGLPILGGHAEPSELILRAVGETPDATQLAADLAPPLAQVIAEGMTELRVGGLTPFLQFLLQQALRLAADLPANAALADNLRALAASLEEATPDFWLQSPLAPLMARALVYQQTDAQTEPLWLRLLETSGKGLWSPERRTVLLSAWRGLLHVPPDEEAARVGRVIDMDRIENGLLALEAGVRSRETGPRLVRQALRVLTETFPRSPQFWEERLEARVRRWPAELSGEVVQLWPGLANRRSPILKSGPSLRKSSKTSEHSVLRKSDVAYCNGIDGTTGDYLFTPSSEELTDLLFTQANCRVASGSDTLLWNIGSSFDPADLDVSDLASTGWGVIFAERISPEAREALSPLLARRREQASRLFQGGYREFCLASDGGRSPWAESSLRELGTTTCAHVEPAEIPYYLLLVGSPEEISFEFQYDLDFGHAVGRICFDTPEEYAAYAEAVIAAEDERRVLCRRATLFGVGNNYDKASERALNDLVYPIVESLRGKPLGWEIETVLGDEATKDRLNRLLNHDSPSFLFTASHGLALPTRHPRQRESQGAIICRDWPGPAWKEAIPPDFYFGADDLETGANLKGLIAFCFACFSGATPEADSFASLPHSRPESPFVARLAQKLLARGALAVVGHVDRIWLHSFMHSAREKQESLVFEQAFRRILQGHRLGYALEIFNRHHASTSVHLANLLVRSRNGETVPHQKIAEAFLATTDARNYILLGDPAVRLQSEGRG